VEYHPIGHRHGPDQICVLHKHLLLSHPTAEAEDSLAMLHWHWLLPRLPVAPTPGSTDDSEIPTLSVPLEDQTLAEEGLPALSLDALALSPDPPQSACLSVESLVSGRLDGPNSGSDPPVPPILHSPSLVPLLQRWTC
jgi:hypothetical protein